MAMITLSNAEHSKSANANHRVSAVKAPTISYSPRTSVYETDSEIVVAYDLPGGKAEDIELRFDLGILSLHCRVAARPQAGQVIRSEYGLGDFYRTFSVPFAIDTSKIEADFKLGVLTVHLPKLKQEKSQQITVRS